MTYKNQFIVEVKCKGKILRVRDDVVHLPFGSEYSLYFKNLNYRRASVKISIDGTDVLDGKALVLNGNSSAELEGFLDGMTAKNKFKFIRKTKEIQDYRGDKIDDGIIRVEFAYEEPVEKTIIHEHFYHYNDPFKWNYNDWFNGSSGFIYKSSIDSFSDSLNSRTVTASYNLNSSTVPMEDEGITVKGSECEQQFNSTYMNSLEEPQVIIMRLKGISDETKKEVHTPITTRTKYICSSCGKRCKSSYKFCPRCGTFLE